MDKDRKLAAFGRLCSLQDDVKAAAQDMLGEKHVITQRCKKETEAVSAFNLFQTPEHIAQRMVDMCGNLKEKTVLEPSAGLGRIVKPLMFAGACVTALDCDSRCVSVLRYLRSRIFGESDLAVGHSDFLDYAPTPSFDAIVMNPPFKNGLDIKHIMHAAKLLKSDGLLVALCYNGVKQNVKLRPFAETWEVLPPDTFKESGTRAGVALLTWRKRL